MNIKKYPGNLSIFIFFFLTFINQACADYKIRQAANSFAFKLFSELNSDSKNIIFSPYSIYSALAMTASGAEGQTFEEMQKVMYLPENKTEFMKAFAELLESVNSAAGKNTILESVNSIWAEKSYKLKADYLALLGQYFSAGINQIDFAGDSDNARQTINMWVEGKTNKKITNLLQPGTVDSGTKLILVNAVYFLGQWQEQFKSDKTLEKDFTLSSGDKISVPFMHQIEKFYYSENESFQMIELPYQGGRIAMQILLPKEGQINVLDDVNDYSLISDLQNNLVQKKVSLAMPKFRTLATYELPKALSALGMKVPFIFPDADFSAMTGNRDFYIGNVIHKAFIEVNESGTEAAAASAVIMRAGAVFGDLPLVFHADHAFLVSIYDKESGIILFLGRINNPKAD